MILGRQMAQGYTSFGVASNFHLSEKFGFERGFDYFSCLPFLPADKVTETVYVWEINYVDDHSGRLIDRLNRGSNALVVITSDHGEEFQEHGEGGHGRNLYQESVRVPLVVKLPTHLKGTVRDRHINLADVMPTILEMMDITPPSDVLGRSCWQEKSLTS